MFISNSLYVYNFHPVMQLVSGNMISMPAALKNHKLLSIQGKLDVNIHGKCYIKFSSPTKCLEILAFPCHLETTDSELSL